MARTRAVALSDVPGSAVHRLLTDRLVLREFTDADRAPFAAMNADPVVMAHFPEPYDRARSDGFVDRIGACWAERGWGLWALELRRSGEFLGYTGLWPAEFEAPFTPAVEVGWRLAASHWGRGYASEAGRASLTFGFDTLDLPRIVSFTATQNVRSQRVMARIGLQRDAAGDFEHPGVPVGHPLRPHVFYLLERQEWERAGAVGPAPGG